MVSTTKRLLACSVGTLAMMAAAPVYAQDNDLDEVVATGIRSSLKKSLDFKRDSNQVVEAITAEDVGKFPDNNIAESLQRISGVAIDRSGGEGQFISVRGLGPEFALVTLNGRTIATDNDGREFSFDTISSSIISSAQVFKTATPNLQSGGIGGNVNISTAKPLTAGTSLSLSAAGIFDTLRDEFSPDLSAIGSWVNDEGTFGALFGASYSDRSSRIDSVFTNGFAQAEGQAAIFAPETSSGLQPSDIGELPAGTFIQQQVVISQNDQDRERLTLNGALQFEPNDNLEFSIDALYSSFDIDSFESQFSGFFTPPFINPQIDENGTVVAFNRPGQTFVDRNPDIGVGLSQNDNVITSENRDSESFAIGGNVGWTLNKDLKLIADASYSRATRFESNPFVVLGALAPESPLIEIPNDDGISTLSNIVGALDTSIQRAHFVNVSEQDNEDEILELKADLEWEINQGPLDRITAGGFYSARDKEVELRDNFAPTQGTSIFCAFCGYTVDLPDEILSPINTGNFLSGVPGSDNIPTEFLNSTFEQAFAFLNSDAAITDAARSGRPSDATVQAALAADPSLTLADIPGTDENLMALRDANPDSLFGFFTPEFNPGGSFSVTEDIIAFHANTEWSGDFGNIPWRANVGFRFAQTDISSTGFDTPVIEFQETAGDTQLAPQFGPLTEITVDNNYSSFLPSANITFETTDNTVLRFAVSQTLTRPTLTSLGVSNTFGGRSNVPTSTGGNPQIEAFESTNYDAAFEWYFDDISFFGVSLFHKRFSDFIEIATNPIPGTVLIPEGNTLFDPTNIVESVVNPAGTFSGLDVVFQDTRSQNGETGDITGVELAFQKGWENGLGVGVNYTYVNSNIDRGADSPVFGLDLNGLSPHTLNVNGFYEKGPWQARVAYNFRDEFLVQAQSFFGQPQQREAFGQVDFSASYDFLDRYSVFVEGINVLGAERRDFSVFRNRFLILEDTGARFTFGVRGSF